MTIKHFIKATLMLAILFASSAAIAQDQATQKKSTEEKAQAQTSHMKQDLGLSDEQNTKAYEILLNSAKQMEAAMKAPGDKKAAIKSISENRDASMKKLLTPGQYAKYEEHMKEMKQRRAASNAQGGGLK